MLAEREGNLIDKAWALKEEVALRTTHPIVSRIRRWWWRVSGQEEAYYRGLETGTLLYRAVGEEEDG